MKWFKDLNNIEYIKAKYKELCRKFHPDFSCSYTLEEMKEINNEYDNVFAKFKDIHKSVTDDGSTYTSEQETTEAPEQFRDIISSLIYCEGLEIDLIGSWIWLQGNTYPYKDVIKGLGFRWANQKKSWYWRSADQTSHNRKKMTLEEIKERHGCQRSRSQKRALIA